MLAHAADAVGAATFSGTWASIKLVLAAPDQRSLAQGLPRTTYARLEALWTALEQDQMCGPCMVFVRRNDILTTLAASAASDTPAGVRSAVLAGLARLVRVADAPTLTEPAVARPLKHLLLSLVPEAAVEPAQASDTASLDSVFSESNAVPWVVRDDPSDAGVAVYPDTAAEGSTPPTASGAASSPELESLVRFLAALVGRTSDCPDLLAALSSHSSKLTRFLPYDVLVPLISLPNPLGAEVRASLLACVEMCMHRAQLPLDGEPDFVLQSLALAQQVAHSDIAPMLGAALGAAYGLLPRAVRLELGVPQDAGGVPIGMRISPEKPDEQTSEDSLPYPSDEDVAVPLANLLGLLEFSSCALTAFLEPGESASPSLSTEDLHAAHTERLHLGLDCAWHLTTSVRTGFLDQILYPAMLECSDADGSATAVFFYLTQMAEHIPDSSPLSAVLLGRLFDDGDEPLPPDADADARKARLRYTLKDLLPAHLRSFTLRDTHTQALRLLEVLIHLHGRLVTRLLLRVTPTPQSNFPPVTSNGKSNAGGGKENSPSPTRRKSVHERRHSRSESKTRPAHGRRASMVSSTEDPAHSGPKAHRRRSSAQPLDKASEDVQERRWLLLRIMSGIVDCLSTLSSFSLGRGLLGLTETNRAKGFGLPSAQREALALIATDSMFQWGMHTHFAEGHRLHPADKVHGLLLSSLAGWFANDPQVNLALSGVIASLVACPVRNLEGWLRLPPSTGGAPVNAKSDTPVVLLLLKGLVGQAVSLRQQVGGELDVLLGERMGGFVYMEQLLDALLEPDDVRTLGSKPPAQGDDKSELVAASKVRKAWDSLSHPSSGGEVSLVESTSKALHAPTPPPPTTRHRDRDGFARLFGGRGRDEPAAEDEHEKVKPVAPGRPFADHYARTEAVQVRVRPLVLPAQYRKTKVLRFALTDSGAAGAREDEVEPTQVSLSSFLDNIVLLREAVRELAALLQARAALGVDV